MLRTASCPASLAGAEALAPLPLGENEGEEGIVQPCSLIRITTIVLGLIVFLVVPHAAIGQTVCAFSAVPCEGWYGAGCYDPAYATCYNGLICTNTSSPCIGRYGAGCYNPAYATCSDGLVCTRPLQPCFGPRGAQCYDPSRATCWTGQKTFHPRR